MLTQEQLKKLRGQIVLNSLYTKDYDSRADAHGIHSCAYCHAYAGGRPYARSRGETSYASPLNIYHTCTEKTHTGYYTLRKT